MNRLNQTVWATGELATYTDLGFKLNISPKHSDMIQSPLSKYITQIVSTL